MIKSFLQGGIIPLDGFSCVKTKMHAENFKVMQEQLGELVWTLQEKFRSLFQVGYFHARAARRVGVDVSRKIQVLVNFMRSFGLKHSGVGVDVARKIQVLVPGGTVLFDAFAFPSCPLVPYF